MKLSKVAKELNVGLGNIVVYLASQGVKVDGRPNTKITQNAYEILKQHFSADEAAWIDHWNVQGAQDRSYTDEGIGNREEFFQAKFIPYKYLKRDKAMSLFIADLNRIAETIPPFYNKNQISISQFHYFCNHKFFFKRYISFEIPKKNGGTRLIHAPVNPLKFQLRCLNKFIQELFEIHEAANGFVKHKSITDNAKMHVGKKYVYNIDLKDFFHCFSRVQIEKMFQKKPFNFNNPENIHISTKLSYLCTHPLKVGSNIETVLPQGSPASPSITNVLCYAFDEKLTSLAKRFNANYSRYADDITFSCDENIFVFRKFLEPLNKIVEKSGFKINENKTRLQNIYFKQEVTGLIVNEKVNVQKRYIKNIRMWLYYLERYDIKKTLRIFSKEYNKDKGPVKDQLPSIFLVIDGKLNFLKMVRGKNDPLYLKLRERFNRIKMKKLTLNDSLMIWEKLGLDYLIKLKTSK